MSSPMQSINKKIKLYYFIIATLLIIVALAVIGRAFYISFVEGNEWRKIGKAQVKPGIPVPAVRGDIYSADRQLMATTETHYRLYIDYWAGIELEELVKKIDESKRLTLDSLLKKSAGVNPDTLQKYLQPLSVELNQLFPQKSVNYYKTQLTNGLDLRKKETEKIKAILKIGKRNDFKDMPKDTIKVRIAKVVRKSREYRLMDFDVNYIEYKKVMAMPYFKKGRFKSGIYPTESLNRINPFGSLALRTIGDIFGELGKTGILGKRGLEMQYDSLLRGVAGTSVRQKINGRLIYRPEVKPINGYDIVTTIDINVQDITEKALLSKLREVDAESGTAVVMDVSTGEIKSIVNLGRVGEGRYSESERNYAVTSIEPGSVFKVVSMMVGLDAGTIQPTDSIEGYGGKHAFGGADVFDTHVVNGKMSTFDVLRYSSNIGMAGLIEKAYKHNPSGYVDGIYKIGIQKKMDLEIPGTETPVIRPPSHRMWSATSLSRMSYGYEVQLPPIYLLTFYNAIANNGVMVKPMFVKEIQKDGKTVEKKKTEVLNPKICSSNTLGWIQQMLDTVVNGGGGTGKRARSEFIKIVGKTGTSRIADGGNYSSTQATFCGYFLVDNKPQYSCIVYIRRARNTNASGGGSCAPVFKEIAEKVYALNTISDTKKFPVDENHPLAPKVKNGLFEPSRYALKKLDISHKDSVEGAWTAALLQGENVIFKSRNITANLVPNVTGMGARDAVFALESAGLKVQLTGRGSVVSQSVGSGERVNKGQTITLELK